MYGYFERGSVVQVENKRSINAISSPARRLVLKQLLLNTNYNISVRERTASGLWSEKSSISVIIEERGR